MQDGKFLQLIP